MRGTTALALRVALLSGLVACAIAENGQGPALLIESALAGFAPADNVTASSTASVSPSPSTAATGGGGDDANDAETIGATVGYSLLATAVGFGAFMGFMRWRSGSFSYKRHSGLDDDDEEGIGAPEFKLPFTGGGEGGEKGYQWDYEATGADSKNMKREKSIADISMRSTSAVRSYSENVTAAATAALARSSSFAVNTVNTSALSGGFATSGATAAALSPLIPQSSSSPLKREASEAGAEGSGDGASPTASSHARRAARAAQRAAAAAALQSSASAAATAEP